MKKLLLALLPVLLALAASHCYRQGSLPLPPQLAAPAEELWQQLRTRWHASGAAETWVAATGRFSKQQQADGAAAGGGHTAAAGGAAPVDIDPARVAQIAEVAASTDSGQCHLPGRGNRVDDLSDCTYGAVHALNRDHVHPLVSQLVKTAFFRFFKVNIYCDCPLWPDDSMCMQRACSVCECGDDEVPVPWLAAEQASARECKAQESPACDTEGCALEMESAVNADLDPAVRQTLVTHASGWRGLNNPWMAEGEEGEEFQYINLLVNPERYTGYKGEHAHRIWSAIYNQSCFTDGVSCSEERVFYRLISGMHASISAHLTSEWLLDETAGRWGPNLEEFERRLGTPEMRDRVENLYFAYLFVLRAVMKAGPVLTSYRYDTGLSDEDAETTRLMTQLLSNPAITESCPQPFDEGRLWRGEAGAALKRQLQATFQNITRVMDCVGCEKCKLWGKLQTLGVATALKVLFSARDCSGALPSSPSEEEAFGPELVLERNEVIALINLLGRFSTSLVTHHRLTGQLLLQRGVWPVLGRGAAVV